MPPVQQKPQRGPVYWPAKRCEWRSLQMSAPFFRGFLTGPATSACLRRATRRRQAPDEARPGFQRAAWHRAAQHRAKPLKITRSFLEALPYAAPAGAPILAAHHERKETHHVLQTSRRVCRAERVPRLREGHSRHRGHALPRNLPGMRGGRFVPRPCKGCRCRRRACRPRGAGSAQRAQSPCGPRCAQSAGSAPELSA